MTPNETVPAAAHSAASTFTSESPVNTTVEVDLTQGVIGRSIASPPLISATDKTVPVTVQVRSTLAPAEAFEIIVPIDLSLVFKKWGPIPGVRGTNNQTGAWNAAGQSRNPDLTDGSTADERITEYTPGHSFAYELTGFTGPMRHLVAGVRGEWTFSPDGQGTMVRWTYEFTAARGRFLLLRWGLVPIWRRYMQNAVTATARAAEQISRSTDATTAGAPHVT